MERERSSKPHRDAIKPPPDESSLIDRRHFELGGGGEELDADADEQDGDMDEERGEEQHEDRAGDASHAALANQIEDFFKEVLGVFALWGRSVGRGS